MPQVDIGVSKSLISGLSPVETEVIRSVLTYENKSCLFQANQWKKSRKWRTREPEGITVAEFEAKLIELQSKVRVCLADQPYSDALVVPTGLLARIETLVPLTRRDRRKPPKAAHPYNVVRKRIPNLRYYQQEQIDACLSAGQGTVVSATGTGKTVCIQEIIRQLGHSAVVVVPSISIASQTVKRFGNYFEPSLVGQFGGGKKQVKPITVAVAASLSKADPADFADHQVLLLDEVHHVAAEQLQEVVYRVLPKAYYRFGFTATPERGDGADLAVEGAAFPAIYTYTVQQGIADGFLARPTFYMLEVRDTNAPRKYFGDNIDKAYKSWILNNTDLTANLAKAIKNFSDKGKQVVALVDEMAHGRQLAELAGATFVHGEGSSCMEDRACAHQTPVGEVVESFNNGTIRSLVGTSCIGEGSDTVPVDVLFKLDGGATRGAVLQTVGRGLRITPNKNSVIILDLYVADDGILQRHSEYRENLYRGIGRVQRIPLAALG